MLGNAEPQVTRGIKTYRDQCGVEVWRGFSCEFLYGLSPETLSLCCETIKLVTFEVPEIA
jgi:hypothetical protein